MIREAILNAVSHRDYRLPGSVFIKQFPRKLELVSPGGFPPGISEANILYRQAPRNRRIAEVLTKCGLVERSGQGVDKIFRESILEGKSHPVYTGTDEYQVVLTAYGDIQNPKFVRFIEELGQEQSEAFSIRDLQVLDLAYRSQAIPDEFGEQSRLVDGGVLERVGRGRGTRYILSRHQWRSRTLSYKVACTLTYKSMYYTAVCVFISSNSRASSATLTNFSLTSSYGRCNRTCSRIQKRERLSATVGAFARCASRGRAVAKAVAFGRFTFIKNLNSTF